METNDATKTDPRNFPIVQDYLHALAERTLPHDKVARKLYGHMTRQAQRAADAEQERLGLASVLL